MTTPEHVAYLDARQAWLEQWGKFQRAADAGLTGAPLVQIDKKLTRLQSEMDAAHDAWTHAS